MKALVRLLGFACAMALVSSCTDSTSVRPFGGTYELVSVEGKPIPQPLYPGTTTPQVIGGTLTVEPDTLNLVLSLLSVDSAGRATGPVMPSVGEIPYVRHGDSLFVVVDTAGQGDGLVAIGPPTPFGIITGSTVRLTLELPIATSTGFTVRPRRILFAPAP